MKTVFLVDGIRSPIGKYGGALSSVRADDLAAHVIRALVSRHPGLDLTAIDDVVFGCANQAGEDNRNIARMASLLAGIPTSVPAMTLNRLCGSGMSAALAASDAILAGRGELFIVGGVEQMTRSPYVMLKPENGFARNPELADSTLGWRFVNERFKASFGTDSMGETAENVAEKYAISREEQDKFAFSSQNKAGKAMKSGRLAREIVPLAINLPKSQSVSFSVDEFPRADCTIEALAKLKPAFRSGGSVTAGNSSGINDGACALLLASEEALKRFQLTPRARLVSGCASGVEPRLMGMGPVSATKKLLAKTSHRIEQLDILELNEAFAAQALACLDELSIDWHDPRVNPNGGAIALGHPLGMSGARLLLSAMIELEVQQKKLALCTMCIGVGQGIASLLERV